MVRLKADCGWDTANLNIGLISLAWWTYIFYYACLTLDLITILTYMFWMGLGLLIFVGFWAYNRRKGIDPRTIYQEIPPLQTLSPFLTKFQERIRRIRNIEL